MFNEHAFPVLFALNDTGYFEKQVNIGLGNCLVSSGINPLPEPVLAEFHDAIWFTW